MNKQCNSLEQLSHFFCKAEVISRALFPGVSDEVLSLISQVRETEELRRGGREVDGTEHGEDEEEPEGSIAEGVVGDGCHKVPRECNYMIFDQRDQTRCKAGSNQASEKGHIVGCSAGLWTRFILGGKILIPPTVPRECNYMIFDQRDQTRCKAGSNRTSEKGHIVGCSAGFWARFICIWR
ncbi:hypothetical protein B0H13DRAFT_1916053 [Mycena leptocephala]|nr:hypothetical protein B0H13DRAFT_1916053 [Mycena leptocephala]